MKARGERITMITAYDATFARMLDEGGADALLVGDSLGMVIQGLDSTLPVTVDEIVYHCRAVARGTQHAHIVGDMPFMSYQGSMDDALRNAGRFLKEGGAHAVKLEGGAEIADKIARIVAAGIPVMGHVGLTPQSVHAMGGFRVQGRTEEAAEHVLGEALACGVPCVATDVGDSREIAGKEGIIAPVGDADGLATGVLAIMARPSTERALLATRMRARALHDYELSAIAHRYWRAQDELLHRSAPHATSRA